MRLCAGNPHLLLSRTNTQPHGPRPCPYIHAGKPQLLNQLPDTVAFLQLLRSLEGPTPVSEGGAGVGGGAGGGGVAATAVDSPAGLRAVAEGQQQLSEEQLPEMRAARVLFRCA